jgi:hypothetical protein
MIAFMSTNLDSLTTTTTNDAISKSLEPFLADSYQPMAQTHLPIGMWKGLISFSLT